MLHLPKIFLKDVDDEESDINEDLMLVFLV